MNLLAEYIGKIVRYIPKNIGAVVGILQTVVAFVREALMLFARLICPIIPGDADEKVVATIKKVVDVIDEFLEKLKNWLLGLGFTV